MANFDARNFYDLAIKIAESYIDEAGFRTAIGRAYYACHLIGANSAKNKGWFKPNHRASDHSALWRELKSRASASLGDQLRELYHLREHADYHVDNHTADTCMYCANLKADMLVDKQTWEMAKTIATHILPKLEAINPKKPTK